MKYTGRQYAVILSLLAVAGAGILFVRLGAHHSGGVEITDLREGQGRPLDAGNTVTVHYVAKLKGGAVYSETRSKDQPFTFVVGKGQVLSGWEQGIRGMKQGGIRKLIIPPELAYGDRGAPPLIPEKATLEVEIELLRVNGP